MLSKISFFTNLSTTSALYSRLYKLLGSRSKKLVNSSKTEGLSKKFLDSSCDILVVDLENASEELYEELALVREKVVFAPFIAFSSQNVDTKELSLYLNLGSLYVLDSNFQVDEFKKTLLHSLKPLFSVNNLKRKIVKLDEDRGECKKLLDLIPPMVAVIKNGEAVEANQRFLDFYGVKDLHEFRNRYEFFAKIFIPLKGYFFMEGEGDWIEFFKKRPSGHRKCTLKDSDENSYKFVIQCKDLDDGEHIVTFSDITGEENLLLDKIKEFELSNSPRANSWKIVRENLSVEVNRAQRYNGVFSLVLFCLSDGKNQTHRLDRMGEQTFGVIEKVTLSTIRPTDMFAKWENNRYFIIAYRTDRDGVQMFAKRLVEEMRKNSVVRKSDYFFKISCVTYQSEDTQNNMIKRAINGLNKALKEPKDSIISDEPKKEERSLF